MTDLSDPGGWLPMVLAQAKSGAGAAPAGEGGFTDQLFGNMMFPIMLTLLLMYFLLMRPEQRKKKDMEKLLAELKANDHVVTIGGLCGVVVNAPKESSYITLRIDDKTGTKVRVLRSAISRIGSLDEAAEEEAKEKK
ncbi:MAG: preprotein translocase subunit YajC [Pirellulaceae bacterium]